MPSPTSDFISHNEVVHFENSTPAGSTTAVLDGSQSKKPATRPQRREVKDEELKLTPYQSIGKVHARNKKKSEDMNFDVHVTAFYIGQPTKVNGEEYHQLLTVAHAFNFPSFQEAEDFIFVPSYAQENEQYVVLPGEKKIHKLYKCHTKTNTSAKITNKFDLCVLYVHPKPLVDLVDSVKIDRLSPLILVANGDFKVETEFKAIGHPATSRYPYGKMAEVQGNFIRSYTLEEYEPQTIQINNVAAGGMSGGPWIIQGKENKLVYGIQSCNTPQRSKSSNATSPYFRSDLFDALELDYITEED